MPNKTQHFYEFGPFCLDAKKRLLLRGDAPVPLTSKAFDTLLLLVQNSQRVMDKDELMKSLWPDSFVEEANLAQNVSTLRKALGETPDEHRFIVTVPGRGYQFVAEVREEGEVLPPPTQEEANGDEVIVEKRTVSRVTVEEAEETAGQSSVAPVPLRQDRGHFQAETPRVNHPMIDRGYLPPARRVPWVRWSVILGGAGIAVLLLVALVVLKKVGGWGVKPPPESAIRIQRLTDFRGLGEFPAVSPDEKSLAFSADVTGRRQIWVRLIAGGNPLQLTHDPADHISPRWSRDQAAILYYLPPGAGDASGTVWEIPALGGTPRPLASSVSEADVSHDGTKLTFFRRNEGHAELVVTDRDGSGARVVFKADPSRMVEHPRWSPDDRWIAFEEAPDLWEFDIYLVPSAGGEPRPITHDISLINGFTWLSDGSGIVYSSARGSTVYYLPTMHLWLARLPSGAPRQMTFDEATYEDPDVDRQGRILASRMHMKFDLWKYPVKGSPSDNVRNGVRLTHQSGQVQTPSPSPDDREISFLSDYGGHGNIWIMKLDDGEMRQVTFERDPAVTLGVPVWSPDGRHIAFASTRSIGSWEDIGYWLVNPDGTNLHNVIQRGAWATWSGDSRWLYYSGYSSGHSFMESRLLKQPIEGGPPVTVRTDSAMSAAVAWDGSALYYVVPLQEENGVLDYEMRVARPESGPSRLLARVLGPRVPPWQGLQPVLSHDGKWLAMPLNDSLGTNIWLLSTADGKMRQVTDFGQLRTFIARRLSWSSDDRFIYAALGEGDSDIVACEGLLP